MASVAQRFNGNLPDFSVTERVHLYRDSYFTIIDEQEYEISYNDPDAEAIMRQMKISILELRIMECPYGDIRLILSRFILRAPRLRLIEIYDKILEIDQQWIRANTNAEVEEYIERISQLASEASTDKVLILDRNVDFDQFTFNFRDRTSYASVKELHIVGEFLPSHLNEVYIEGFITFIRGFPKLKSIDACIILRPTPEFRAFNFYDKMKEIEPRMFDELPKELHGIIHFGAEVKCIGRMPCVMRNDIEKHWSKVKHPIIIDEEKGRIQRKFKLNKRFSLNYRNYFYHKLKIKLSIYEAPQ